MNQIKNIIFDLGGVLINLDIPATIEAFNKFSSTPFEAGFTQQKQTSIFDDFDKGTITENDFFAGIKDLFTIDAQLDQMKNAWNKMLLDFPDDRLELLKKLKPRYRLFLLSNTNETHVTVFENKLKEIGYVNLEPFFEKVYYSCRIGMRKPNKNIFEYVLNENKLIANETLFIDDTQQHVDGALEAGINAMLLPKNSSPAELLRTIGIQI